MSRTVPPRRALAVAVLLALAACEHGTGPDESPIPPETGDGWATGAPKSVGMASGPLLAMAQTIDDTPGHEIHGFLVVRHNTLVFERYWRGTDLEPVTLAPVEKEFDRNTLHYVASVSKSLTSALMGIAMDRTGIGAVSDSIFRFFQEHADLTDSAHAGITLEHLLTFTSGLEWNEFVYGFDDPRDSHNRMFAAADPVRYLLGRPVTFTSGSRFHYNSGDTNLLGEIVRRMTSAATLVDYADARLFGPLGIEAYAWIRFGRAPEVTFASGGASLRPRDMAKVGQTYLDGGVWHGVEVVPAAWVDASLRQSIPVDDGGAIHGYGYNWWLGRSRFRDGYADFAAAMGWGGQYIFIYPELDLVIVHTGGGYYYDRPLGVHGLIQDYILEAIED